MGVQCVFCWLHMGGNITSCDRECVVAVIIRQGSSFTSYTVELQYTEWDESLVEMSVMQPSTVNLLKSVCKQTVTRSNTAPLTAIPGSRKKKIQLFCSEKQE